MNEQTLELALEALHEMEQRCERIDRRLHLNLESHSDSAFLRTVEDQQRELGRELGLENMESVRMAVSAAKNTGAIMFQATAKAVEALAVQLDTTGGKALEQLRRKVDAVDGDLPSGDAVVVDRKLADLLHVNGQVPDAPLEALREALATSSHLRTVVIPAIGASIDAVFAKAFEGQDPKTAADYTRIADVALQQTAQVKTLLDFFSPAELLSPYVGGYTLGLKSETKAETHAGQGAAGAEQKVQARLNKINATGVVLNQKPGKHRKKADTFQVPLLSRQDVNLSLNLAAKVIGEGQGLRALSKRLGKITGKALAQTAMLTRDVGLEKKLLSDEDARKLNLVQAFFKHSLVQHQQILTVMSVILFQSAKAYLALVEKSAQHYK